MLPDNPDDVSGGEALALFGFLATVIATLLTFVFGSVGLGVALLGVVLVMAAALGLFSPIH